MNTLYDADAAFRKKWNTQDRGETDYNKELEEEHGGVGTRETRGLAKDERCYLREGCRAVVLQREKKTM